MIATKEKLKALADKGTSNLLVVSDSHGNKANLEKVLDAKGRECDALLFLGDGIEDLLGIIEDYFHVPEDISIMPPVVAFVKGNGDNSVYSYFTDTNHRIEIPETQEITASGKRIFMAHGHRFSVYYTTDRLAEHIRNNKFDAGLFGHTHVPFQERLDGRLLLNPGSISLPRNHSDRCYAVLTISKNEPEIKYKFYTLD